MFTGDFYDGKLCRGCAAKFTRHFLPGAGEANGAIFADGKTAHLPVTRLDGTMRLDLGSARVPRAAEGVAPSALARPLFHTVW
jgi:hypothetical protein